MDVTNEAYGFKAEIKQLLHILAHSLYKDRDIFLRELVSNASDALTRLQFEALTNSDIVDPDAEPAIYIDFQEATEGAPAILVIKDTGIGMSHDEIVRNLGTIAQSGAREFLATLGKADVDPGDVIGQFGVGFYSVFMVAERVRVVSRSFRPEAEAVVWSSDGGDEFNVEPAEKSDRGTEIHVVLKTDAQEFANAYRLKQIIKKYSDYVRFPIYVQGEQANRRESLWRKASSEVSAEDHKNFYRQMAMDFEDPLLTIQFASDSPVNLRALLFLPRRRDRGVLSTRKEPGVMLYSHNVLIQEYCTDLLPSWLAFVDGVVDSEDLPLNVSRETVQNNRLMQQLGKSIKSRIVRELKKLGENDAEKYAQFIEEYGPMLKEGLATDRAAADEIIPLLRYHSTHSDGGLTSLDQYIGRMPDGQDGIYFVIGDSLAGAARSPHLDPFKAKGIEVLYFHEPLDIFVAPMLDQYREKRFINAASADVDMPEKDTSADETASEGVTPEADFNRFVGLCVTALGERVTEVRSSRVLKDSPVRLVAPEGQVAGLQRIYRMMGREYTVPAQILEVNRNHPLVAGLARLATTSPSAPLLPLAIEQLYASALVQEGLHPNPSDMLPRIQELMLIAAQALSGDSGKTE
jgi:molecular chaperone HtpG